MIPLTALVTIREATATRSKGKVGAKADQVKAGMKVRIAK
jgi:hypothetical protein